MECELEDRSGTDRSHSLADLADPVADKILAARGTQGCPQSLEDIHTKLEVTDAEHCDGGMFSAVQTVLVSERAQLRRTAQGSSEGCTPDPIAAFRGVTTRTCGGRPAFALSMAVFGLTVDSPELPTDVELIGFDQQRGVFNYYSLEQGRWVFHGDSIDLLQGASADGERRCAACHVGGGLVLKELRSPWVFWEGRDTLAGVERILSAHPQMGSRAEGKVLDLRPAGKELEETIDAGNRAWTETRVNHLLAHGSLQDVLRPVFCSMEFELRAAAQTVTSPAADAQDEGTLAVDASELWLDPALRIDERITLSVADYHQAIAASGQRVERACGSQLEDSRGQPIVDTVFDLVHPFRSASDTMVVQALLDRGVLDEGLVRAIVGVDFTRPVFSELRCGLLESVPELPAARRDAKTIRRALLEALQSEEHRGRPGTDQLVSQLRDPDEVLQRARTFVRACQRRPSDELARDVVRDVSRRRRAARKRPVLEVPEMLPTDDYPPSEDGRLDPETCRFDPAGRTG